MGYLKKKFRDIKKFPNWIYWLPAKLLNAYFHLFFRFEIVDPFDLASKATGKIPVTWHNRLLFFPVAFPAHQRRRTLAVVSASRDGQYLTDFIRQFELGSLRGSSKRGGANALLGALHAIEAGYHVAFTPDGPRGPRYTMKLGPLHLASRTGHEIVPIAINVSRCWQLKSWDGFQIPKPFSSVKLVLGEPIAVPPALNEEQLEEYRVKVENALREITVDPPAKEEQK